MNIIPISETSAWLMGFTLFLMVLDYGTGVLKAAKAHDLQSRKMRDGLWHKLGFVAALALAESIDFVGQHVELPFAGAILPAVAIYLIIAEVTSILENLKEISPELSQASFLQIFQSGQMQNETNENKEDHNDTPRN